MSKTVITSPNAPAAIGTYSQAVKAGNTVYMSGQIGLDPEASADNRAPKALEPLFQFEMQFTGPAQPRYLGGGVHVRISHNPAPLGEQWYRSLRQQFMKRFAV